MVTGPQARFKAIQDFVEKSGDRLGAVLPKHLTKDRFVRLIVSAVSRTPALLDCSKESIVLAAAQAAALGIEPNTPLGLGYLIPFRNKQSARTEAQFIPSFKGLVRLAIQSGEVQKVCAHIVHERDTFEIAYGTDERIVHMPYLGKDGPGDILGAYAVAEMKNGSKQIAFMTLHELEAIRLRSKSPEEGPWVTDRPEMYKKTVVRRLSKMLPLSEEKYGRALEHQATAEAGNAPDFSDMAVLDVSAEPVDEPPPADRGEALASKIKTAAAS
jgi:recombination protein RecT